MTTHDEERIAGLLSLLKPAPEAWVKAAQELPLASRTLDVHIRRLRKILEADGPRILTVRGVGYRMDLSEDRVEFEGAAEPD